MRPPRRQTSWLEDFPRRLRLQQPAFAAYPGLTYKRRQRQEGAVYVYQVKLEVPGYESRRVSVEFHAGRPNTPRVYADGPASRDASPHRYAERGRCRLCIWYPSDPPDQRWVPDDGLLALCAMIAVHLFKEAYWREHDQWLGDEFPHAELTHHDARQAAQEENSQ